MSSTITSLVPPAKIASLEQLDALVGRYVMDDHPAVYWEHSYSHWRFDNLSDALEALNDPFFASLVPEAKRASLSVAEVREFPAYSTDLTAVMRLVERLGAERKSLTLLACSPKWAAYFGHDERVEGPSPAVAICIAALRTRGIEVELARTLGAESSVAA